MEERIEWLATFCNLPPRATQVLRALAARDEWTPIGKLVDALRAPAFELAQMASPTSPLRQWGLVRLRTEPEPSLRLTPRTWGLVHVEVRVRITDVPLH